MEPYCASLRSSRHSMMKPYCAALRSSCHSYLFSGEIQKFRLRSRAVGAQAQVFQFGVEGFHQRLAVFGLIAREPGHGDLALAARGREQFLREDFFTLAERVEFGAQGAVHGFELAALVLDF